MKLTEKTIELIYRYGDRYILRQLARRYSTRAKIARMYLEADPGMKTDLITGHWLQLEAKLQEARP